MNILEKRDWFSPAMSLLIAGGALTLLSAVIRKSVPLFIEGALLTSILGLLFRLPPMREAILGWPRRWRLAAITLLVLMLGGQLHGKVQDIFPFIRWDMFTTGEPRDVVSYFDFVGQRADGSEVKFVPSPGGMFSFRRMLGTAGREKNDPQMHEERRESARRRFDGYGPLVLEVYNRDHPREPIVSYKVYENRKFLKEHPRVERILLGAWPPAKEAR